MTDETWTAIVRFVKAEFVKQGSPFKMDVDTFLPRFNLSRDDYLEITDRLSLRPTDEQPFEVKFQQKGTGGAPCDLLIFSS